MEFNARLGVAVVQLVAGDLGAGGTDAVRVHVRRAEGGRFWELGVSRQGAAWLRVVARVHRSTQIPWRLNRLTYFLIPAQAGPVGSLRQNPGVEARAAWKLIKAGKVAREVELVASRLLPHFDQLEPDPAVGGSVLIDSATFDRIVAGIFDLEDALDALRALACEDLAIPGFAIDLPVAEIAEQAAVELELGSADPDAIRLAASLLTAERGLPALAIGLAFDNVRAWGTTSVAEVLGAFIGADEQFVGHVCEAAKLQPTDAWQSLTVQQLSLMVRALMSGLR